MKNLKKVMLAVVLILILSGCKKNSEQNNSSENVTEKSKNTETSTTREPESKYVVFKDSVFEGQIRLILGKPNGQIEKSECLTITKMDLEDSKISDISGIENFKNLTSLNLDNNNISSIEALSELTNLTFLTIGKNPIKSISSLKDLKNLEILTLSQTLVTDISVAATLPKLISIPDTFACPITDYSAFEPVLESIIYNYINHENMADNVAEESSDYIRTIYNERVEGEKEFKRVYNEIVKPNMSELEKVVAFYNYLTMNVKYGWDESIPVSCEMLRVFKYNFGICHDYSIAFSMLCKEAGIESVVVMADVYEVNDGVIADNWYSGHAWNAVKINGKYYQLDATWGTVGEGGGSPNYDYFSISDETMKRLHSEGLGGSAFIFSYSYYPDCLEDMDRSLVKPYQIQAYNN